MVARIHLLGAYSKGHGGLDEQHIVDLYVCFVLTQESSTSLTSIRQLREIASQGCIVVRIHLLGAYSKGHYGGLDEQHIVDLYVCFALTQESSTSLTSIRQFREIASQGCMVARIHLLGAYSKGHGGP